MLRAILYSRQVHLERLHNHSAGATIPRGEIEKRCKHASRLASYRSRRHQLAEEVPGLYIRRLTLEDPKIARERPDSAMQSPARHVCHPRASYVPSDRPTSRSWLEQRRRERQAVLTITSLELPDCPVPLIDSLSSNRCRTANSRSAEREETLNEWFAKVAEVRARKIDGWESNGQDAKGIHERDARQQHEIESCCEEKANIIQGCSPETVARPNSSEDGGCSSEGEDGDGKESGQAEVESKHELAKGTKEAGADKCTCSEFSEKLRINIRKKTEVRRSSRSHSPEVTHTIRIAMKCQGQREQQPVRKQERRLDTPDLPSASDAPELQPFAVESPSLTPSCCQGFNLALGFNLNCSGLQLTSRNFSVRPIVAVADLDEH